MTTREMPGISRKDDSPCGSSKAYPGLTELGGSAAVSSKRYPGRARPALPARPEGGCGGPVFVLASQPRPLGADAGLAAGRYLDPGEPGSGSRCRLVGRDRLADGSPAAPLDLQLDRARGERTSGRLAGATPLLGPGRAGAAGDSGTLGYGPLGRHRGRPAAVLAARRGTGCG